MNRRNLLHAAACATAGLMAGLRPAFAADAEIEISPQAAGPVISPHIYGHFIEHLGAVIYDGIWVGRDSRIPNLDGIRRRFVDDMKRIGGWIATVLKAYAAKPDIRDESFVQLCHDVLGSSRWDVGSNPTIKLNVDVLIKKFAA